MTLIVKNNLGFVDGTIVPPEEHDPLFCLWRRNNNIVASWILNANSEDITASVIHSSSAAAMRKELFHQRNGPRIFQLKRELHNCVQGSMSVVQYLTKVK